MKKILIIICASALIFACTKKETKETPVEEKQTPSVEEMSESIAKNCTYAYNDSTTTFGWKAYKTNEKIGVGGTFDEIEVSSMSANSIKEVLGSISFVINTGSVNSNNEDRDGKLITFFFDKMIGTNSITGKVKSIEGSETVGSATFEITMNEVTQDVAIAYTTTEGVINFSGEITMDDFNGQDAVAALNKKCEALHTGADGVSILWPQVSLTFSTQLTAVCD